MKITGRDYALAAAKANRENKILRIKNGEFIFDDAPFVADENDSFRENDPDENEPAALSK